MLSSNRLCSYGAASKTPGIGSFRIFDASPPLLRSPFTHLSLSPIRLTENSTVAVFGAGCVGLALLQGAQAKKSSRIISIDTNPAKKEVALKFGATEFINPLTDVPEGKTIAEYLVDITDGGLDFTFDATGNVRLSFSSSTRADSFAC